MTIGVAFWSFFINACFGFSVYIYANSRNNSTTTYRAINPEDEFSVMAIGLGDLADDKSNRNIQLFNLTSGQYCDPINKREEQDFPGISRSSAEYIGENSLITCGGYEGYMTSRKCYNYSLGLNEWSEFGNLSDPKFDARSVVLGDGNIWVTGGAGGWQNDRWLTHSSTDIINITDWKIIPGPELPSPASGHCLIQLNTTHTIVIGTRSQKFSHNTKVTFYNWKTSQWTEGPAMKYKHSGHACAKLITEDGDVQIFVFGGYPDSDKVEIFKNGEWTRGEDIPVNFVTAKAVAFNKYIILTGTALNWETHKYSWRYDTEENKWSQYFEMDPPLKYHFATLVPHKYCKQSAERKLLEDPPTEE